MQSMGKSVMRVAKNSIKGYSDVQTKVRDATSNDPWGPSGTQMSEIAALTFNQNDFVEIIEMLDKRLNDKGKNWRHVFKSLTLLDYMLHSGSENCVMYFRENMYIIKTLKEFQYIDEFGKDQGANVRQKAKDITNLLLDERRMKDSRRNRADMNGRLQGEDRSHSSQGREDQSRAPPRRAQSVPAGGRGGDNDLAEAIRLSKLSAEEDAARARRGGKMESDLEEAMRLSREEDERRKRELANQRGEGLFDDQQNSNNLIDIDAPLQHPMQTGMAFSSFNPYAQQAQLQQEEWARQQQMMELQRQADEQAQAYQNMMQQQAYAQQQQMAQEEYMRQQAYQQQLYMQQQQQQPLVPQPTAYGSNNPFAAFAPTPSLSPPPPPPSNNSYEFSTPAPAPAPAPSPVRQQTRPHRDDGKHAELARMLAGGREDGLDTFGNIGSMRVPVGQQFATKTGMNAQATGSNPFGQRPQQQQQQQGPNNPFFDL